MRRPALPKSVIVNGSFAEDLRSFAAVANGIVHWLATRAAYLPQNLSALNVVSSVAHGQPVAGSLIFLQDAVRPVLCSHGSLGSSTLQ